MTPYYDEDGITIYHGRCEDVLTSVRGVACTVTSPPYNTLGSRVPDSPTGMHANNGWLRKVTKKGYADDMGEEEYAEWQGEVCRAVAAATQPGGAMFYNHKVRYRDKVVVHPLDLVRSFSGWHLRQEIVWDRCGAFAFNARMFAPSDERVYWMARDGGGATWNQEAAGFLTVWRIPPPSETSDHPCPFPVRLPERCIVATTAPGDLVLDPHMGAGTTMLAAKLVGRRGIGIEVDESYCEIAAKRLAQGVLFGASA